VPAERVVVASKGAGKLHAVVAEGRAFRASCGARLAGSTVEQCTGRLALRAWRLGPRCATCADHVRRRVTGWEVTR
jgi:hypothetical protein